MATIEHPLTGVRLNSIDIERKSLTFKDAVTAVILRTQGHKYQHIAQFLGTNTHRLGEVFREEEHVGAKGEALRLLTNDS